MLLLAKLSHRIVTIYEQKFSFDFINLQSESQIALTQCKTHACRWSTFISNRVAQIKKLTINYQRRHIKSKGNQTDLSSRGIFSKDIIKLGFWLSGLQLLSKFNINIDNCNIPLEVFEFPGKRILICAALAIAFMLK